MTNTSKFISILSIGLFLASCRTESGNEKLQEESKKVGTSAIKAIKGIKVGIENATKIDIEMSEALKERGITLGKIKLDSKNGGRHNVLNVYMIFDANFNKSLTMKVVNNNGEEVGRTKTIINAKADDAKYIDFVFDKNTNIDRDFKISLQ